MSLELLATEIKGRATQTAGTVISVLLPPKKKAFTRVTTFKYTCGATAHTVTAMQSLGMARLSAAAASGQAVIKLAEQPVASGNNVAANDFLVVEFPDGTFALVKVSSVSGLTITLTANLAAALAKGSRVWMLGVVGDGHPQHLMTVSVVNTFQDTLIGVAQSKNPDEPLVLQSDNATNAGSFELVSAAYSRN